MRSLCVRLLAQLVWKYTNQFNSVVVAKHVRAIGRSHVEQAYIRVLLSCRHVAVLHPPVDGCVSGS